MTQPRKPTDTTLRNLRKTRKDIAALEAAVKALARRVRTLERGTPVYR